MTEAEVVGLRGEVSPFGAPQGWLRSHSKQGGVTRISRTGISLAIAGPRGVGGLAPVCKAGLLPGAKRVVEPRRLARRPAAKAAQLVSRWSDKPEKGDRPAAAAADEWGVLGGARSDWHAEVKGRAPSCLGWVRGAAWSRETAWCGAAAHGKAAVLTPLTAPLTSS